MTTFCCKKCGSLDLFTKESGTQTGLYCKDCGAWLKWLGKEELRLVELQLAMQNAVEEEPINTYDLSNISDEDLLAEVARRMK